MATTSRRSRPHPARQARRTTGMVAAASTLGLVSIMGVQSAIDNLQGTSTDEGVSALNSTSQTPQVQFDDSEDGAYTITIEPQVRRRGSFLLRPSVPSSQIHGSSRGS